MLKRPGPTPPVPLRLHPGAPLHMKPDALPNNTNPGALPHTNPDALPHANPKATQLPGSAQNHLSAADRSGGVLAKVATGALLVGGLAVAGIVSLLILAIAFVVGAGVLGYFAWKIRKLRSQGYGGEAFTADRPHPGFGPHANARDSHTLDGDYIRPKNVSERNDG